MLGFLAKFGWKTLTGILLYFGADFLNNLIGEMARPDLVAIIAPYLAMLKSFGGLLGGVGAVHKVVKSQSPQ